jgi:hypothetical protein
MIPSYYIRMFCAQINIGGAWKSIQWKQKQHSHRFISWYTHHRMSENIDHYVLSYTLQLDSSAANLQLAFSRPALPVPLTRLSAASAIFKSPSLRLLNAPPPGVLAPLIIDPDRERTFITSGLYRCIDQYHSRQAGEYTYNGYESSSSSCDQPL